MEPGSAALGAGTSAVAAATSGKGTLGVLAAFLVAPRSAPGAGSSIPTGGVGALGASTSMAGWLGGGVTGATMAATAAAGAGARVAAGLGG